MRLNHSLFAVTVFAFALLLTACASSPQESGRAHGPYWTGGGGRGASIAVFNMSSHGLSADEQHIPLKIRGALVEAFNRYSAMDVMDMVVLEQLIRDGESDFYADNNEIIQMGRVVPSRYQLRGNIHRTPAGVSVQFNVVQASNARQTATFTDSFLITQIDDLSGIRRASGELLTQMGIRLTAAGQEALTRPASASQIQAHDALARGISAQRLGTEVTALSFYLMAAAFDPGMAEAVSRRNILAADISSGNIGEDIRNDIHWRDQWVTRLAEANAFFVSHMENPPFYIVYSIDLDHQRTDFHANTADFSGGMISIIHDANHFIVANRVIRTVREGLLATGRAADWGLADWPLAATPQGDIKNPAVVVELLNADGQSLSRVSLNLEYGWRTQGPPPQRSNDRSGWYRRYHAVPVFTLFRNFDFRNVPADLITGSMTVRIQSIGGIPTEQAARQKRLSVLTEQDYNTIASVRANGLDFPNLRRFHIASPVSMNNVSTIASQAVTQSYNIFVSVLSGVSESTVTIPELTPALIIPHGALTVGGFFADRSPEYIDLGRTSDASRRRLDVRTVTEITIPESVHSVDFRFFPGDSRITSVVIPDSVRTLYLDNRNMGRLRSLTLPANLDIQGWWPHGLQALYLRNDRRAGTYYLRGGRWRFQP